MLSETIERPRREVTFFERVYFRRIPSHRIMSNEEKSQLWIDDSDMISVDDDRKETLALMDAGLLTGDDEGYCTRGLYTQEENRKKYRRMKRSRRAVFTRQELQLLNDYFDEQDIAIVYTEAAYSSRIRAQRQGDKDHMESYNYCSDVRVEDDEWWYHHDLEHSRDPLSPQHSLCDRGSRSHHGASSSYSDEDFEEVSDFSSVVSSGEYGSSHHGIEPTRSSSRQKCGLYDGVDASSHRARSSLSHKVWYRT